MQRTSLTNKPLFDKQKTKKSNQASSDTKLTLAKQLGRYSVAQQGFIWHTLFTKRHN